MAYTNTVRARIPIIRELAAQRLAKRDPALAPIQTLARRHAATWMARAENEADQIVATKYRNVASLYQAVVVSGRSDRKLVW